jgi:hypothetical protein
VGMADTTGVSVPWIGIMRMLKRRLDKREAEAPDDAKMDQFQHTF